MDVLTLKDFSSDGVMIFLYGETNVGKSTSILQSAPDPIFYAMGELRNPKKVLEAVNRPGLKIRFGHYKNWLDFMDFLAQPEKLNPYKSLIIDSMTQFMGLLSIEIENETFQALGKKKQVKKTLSRQTKKDYSGWGGLASQTLRLTKLLGKLSQIHGKIIICTALETERPKWDLELAAAPKLSGRDYAESMPENFDLIGRVTSRYKKCVNEDGCIIPDEYRIVYPPMVSFECDDPDRKFMAKYTGGGDKRKGPLNISKILESKK